MITDIIDLAFKAFLSIIIISFALFVAAVFADAIFGIAAEEKIIACEVKRLHGRRISLSTNVVCVPRSLDTRNDTLTVQTR